MIPSVARLWRAQLSWCAVLALTACSHLPHPHWPWHSKAPPPPETSTDLVATPIGGTQAAAYPEFWKRNTLVLDLSSVSGSGGVELRLRSGAGWPVRLALRVMPGSVGRLDVHADERVVIPVVPQGAKPLDLELPPGLYGATTEKITVSWSPLPPS